MNDVIAIIPARGNSKGVPRKNVRLLAGKPLIAHSIEQALLSQTVRRVIVSTDDDEISSTAQQYGAEVIKRPAELSGATASSESALLHVLETMRKSATPLPDILVFLQCTSPLTIAEDIDGTVNALIENNADTALAVIRFDYFIWRIDSDGNAVGINHDKAIRQRRQDRAAQYEETGAVYAMRTDGFISTKHRFFGKTALYCMPQERCLEIDTPFDFEQAEYIMSRM